MFPFPKPNFPYQFVLVPDHPSVQSNWSSSFPIEIRLEVFTVPQRTLLHHLLRGKKLNVINCCSEPTPNNESPLNSFSLLKAAPAYSILI
jgi:hypothetical protein